MKGKKNKRFFEMRFSLFSLASLASCWLGIALIAFYLGFVLGRADGTGGAGKRFQIYERLGKAEKQSPLVFPAMLVEPEETSEGMVSLDTQPSPSDSRSPAMPELERSRTAEALPPPDMASAAKPVTRLGEGAAQQVKKGGSLQVGSFREQKRAEGLLKTLRGKGYPCFVVSTVLPSSGSKMYRVFVGPFQDADRTEEARTRLRKQEGLAGILVRSETP